MPQFFHFKQIICYSSARWTLVLLSQFLITLQTVHTVTWNYCQHKKNCFIPSVLNLLTDIFLLCLYPNNSLMGMKDKLDYFSPEGWSQRREKIIANRREPVMQLRHPCTGPERPLSLLGRLRPSCRSGSHSCKCPSPQLELGQCRRTISTPPFSSDTIFINLHTTKRDCGEWCSANVWEELSGIIIFSLLKQFSLKERNGWMSLVGGLTSSSEIQEGSNWEGAESFWYFSCHPKIRRILELVTVFKAKNNSYSQYHEKSRILIW